MQPAPKVQNVLIHGLFAEKRCRDVRSQSCSRDHLPHRSANNGADGLVTVRKTTTRTKMSRLEADVKARASPYSRMWTIRRAAVGFLRATISGYQQREGRDAADADGSDDGNRSAAQGPNLAGQATPRGYPTTIRAGLQAAWARWTPSRPLVR